jgi:hypothetical protein
VALKVRQRLETANRKIKSVYFIENGLASVVAVAEPSAAERKCASSGARE